MFGGSPEVVPLDVIQAAFDGFFLKVAILAILADGQVSDHELQTAWPMTSELAESIAERFTDLRGFNHQTTEGHCAFLDAYRVKDGWFGAQCEWTMWIAPF